MSDTEGPPPGSDILQQAKDTLPEITVTDWTPPGNQANISQLDGQITAAGEGGDDQEDIRTDKAAEVLRQVEHYFSEQNLPHDAHLLGLLEEGDGTVSFNEICSFKAMRQLTKQKSWIKEVLKCSTLIEVIQIGKKDRIRRKIPLQTTPTVAAKVNQGKPKTVVPEDKPWLSKGMMKPTGFEEGAIDTADLEQDSVDYPADESFTTRIETAIGRFSARRKMHQDHHKIFDRFLVFGGFRGGQAQFIGGVDGKAEEDCTKKEKSERTARYDVSEQVRDGLDGTRDCPSTWFVNFEAVVKAFFSSQFTAFFAWYDVELVKTATNTISSFHKYLLIHKVCPEYDGQVNAAIKACELAKEELPKLAEVDRHLPGGFNVACSMLFDGHHSDQLAQGDWAQGTQGGSWDVHQARAVFKTGVFAYGTKEQIKAVERSSGHTNPFGETSDLKVGLEIVAIEMPTESAWMVYKQAAGADPALIKAMGKLHCKEWKVPTAPPVDLPVGVRDARRDPDPAKEYTFLLEASTLEFCYIGCKFEATIKLLKDGFTWIDYHEATYASFFTWLVNERIREWKEPGPPTGWMTRQNEKKNGGGMELELVADDDELD